MTVPASILLAGVMGVFIGSNPVGWAIGAAIVAGGVMALTAASIAIFRGKDLHPGEILAPMGNGAMVACIALIVVIVIAAAVGEEEILRWAEEDLEEGMVIV
ncbi:MAG: hypothetical protein HWD61_03175 [Parachlamydiaceae bacterium]|nr:MAG: hypothetical protein HWD61_03175 [Parachlamydiaceae bacterium]